MGRKKHSKELKSRIALDAIKGQKTMSELASEYGVHANQISRWKKQLLDAAPDIFTRGKDKEAENKEIERDRLYKKVGQLQVEVDWLKKRQVIWDERWQEDKLHRSQRFRSQYQQTVRFAGATKVIILPAQGFHF